MDKTYIITGSSRGIGKGAALSLLKSGNTFEKYQQAVVKNGENSPSHKVISKYIKKYGKDLRFEESPHPDKAFHNREIDNTETGRIKGK